MRDDVDGSLSTLPLGFKPASQTVDFRSACIKQLLAMAQFLAELRQSTGRTIRLAIEPEPLCVLETTAETIAFFYELWTAADQAACGEIAREHLGLCLDICHQAVEFENVAASISMIHAAQIRINKVHISSALQLDDPLHNHEGRHDLRLFVEPRYLHQTFGLRVDGSVARVVDLTDELLREPPPQMRDATTWRVHYHVPITRKSHGALTTTQAAISEALQAVAALDYAPHLEVETYTWTVFPGEQPVDLIVGITGELQSAQTLIDKIRQTTH
jgi:hypothetical protein